MHFGLSDEETELVTMLHGLLEKRADSLAVRAAMGTVTGYDPALWSVLCDEVGVAALAIPEEFGGAGFGYFSTHLVLEELGYSLAHTPLLGSISVGQALLLSGDSESCERLLPAIADGGTGALAWADERGRWRTDGSDIVAEGSGDDWSLRGMATLVLDGATDGLLLAVARTPTGVGLFEVTGTAGITRKPTPALDPTLTFALVTFDGAPARPLSLDAEPMLSELRDVLAVATSALQVGAARRGLDLTVRYSKERVQFGRQIGSFQALKHGMADMLLQVETARTVSWAAAWAVQTTADDLAAQAALAKAWCTDAAELVASETVQLHGGIAITWEHDAQLVFKRAHALSQLFGDAAQQRRRLAELSGFTTS